jgi:hypothetical protein
MALRLRHIEPKFNKKNGSTIRGVPKDWSEGIHSVNGVPRPNSPCCTYCH